MRNLFRALKHERGQSAVLLAIALVAMIGFAALVVDMGISYGEKSDLQNVADAAALAGALELPNAATASGTAREYVERNGIDCTTSVVSPYQGSPTLIEVVCTKTVSYTFARILGLEGRTISAKAVAQKVSLSGAFDYTLFSGNHNYTLALNGSGQYIKGSAHSNDKFMINGSSQTITENAEAVSSFTANGSSITIGGICQGSSIRVSGSNISIGSQIASSAASVAMPDFSATIQSQAAAVDQVYNGDKTFSGSNLSADGSIYVNGNVTINGSSFSGKGCILATGNITFNGSNLTNGSGDAVCFYSKNGNITINGSCAGLHGIIYAPNGTITLNGSNQTINGRVIGDKVLINGSSTRIIGGSEELTSIPSGYSKLYE